MSVKLSKFRVDDTMIEIDVPDGSVTEEKLSPEVAEKLNSGGEIPESIEVKTLDVEVTFGSFISTYIGFITSDIPDNIEINTLIGVYELTTENDIDAIRPLPTIKSSIQGTGITVTSVFDYQWVKDINLMPPEYASTMKLGFTFSHTEYNAQHPESYTKNVRIIYI